MNRPLLIQLRIDAGLSQRAAAGAIGVNRETYRNAEAGRDVSVASMHKIATHFGVAVTDIWPVDGVSSSLGAVA